MNKTGKIIKIISNSYTVLIDDQNYICKARGKFRNLNISPVVGDNVLVDIDKLYIQEILERKNNLIRPLVSNIDQCIVIASVKDPDLDLYLLDKLLCIIEYNNIKPVICFTKIDLLLSKDKIDEVSKYYESIGYAVFYNYELSELSKIFKDKVSVFTGQSGAGKSTLLNNLDSNLNIKTDEISKALGRGKHTTRHVELIPLFGGMCADTPGFSSLSLTEMQKSDIRDNMIEFNIYRQNCKYKDCMHDKEDDCYIKTLVGKEIKESRYLNYLKFIKGETYEDSSLVFRNKR